MKLRVISQRRRSTHRIALAIGVGLISLLGFQTASAAADAQFYLDRMSTAIAHHKDLEFKAEISMTLSGTPTRTYYVHAAVRRPNMMRITVSPTGYDNPDSILTVSNSDGIFYCNLANKHWSKAPSNVGLNDCLQYLPNSLSLRTALAYLDGSPFQSLIAANDTGSVDLVDHDAKSGDVTLADQDTSSGTSFVRRMRIKEDGTPIRYAVLASNANGSETDVESFTLIRDGNQLPDSYFAWNPPSDCVEGSDLARNAPFHLVYTPGRHVRMTLTETAQTNALITSIYACLAKPPDLPTQQVLNSDLQLRGSIPVSGSLASDFSPLHRPMLRASLSATTPASQNGYAVSATYEATLSSVREVLGPSSEPVPPLSDSNREFYTAARGVYDIHDATFIKWIDANSLKRDSSEGPVNYARRIFRFIRTHKKYAYIEDQDRRPSNICTSDSTDCGGMSVLFVSLMRANGVPARAMIGWCPNPQSDKITDVIHVRAEFFVDGIGWIPVDPAKGGFGDVEELLVLQVDMDFVPTDERSVDLQFCQLPYLWETFRRRSSFPESFTKTIHTQVIQ